MKIILKYKSLILLIILLAFLTQTQDSEKNETVNTNQDTSLLEVESDKEEDTILIFDKEPAWGTEIYFEDTVSVNGRPIYYAYPLEIDLKNPPRLIIYSHGQLQEIQEDKEDPYMVELRKYAQFFTSKGYAFIAPDLDDKNWNAQKAPQHITRALDWLKENEYYTKEKYTLIGFSLGGLTTMNFAIENYKDINSVILLAPTPKKDLTLEEVNILKDIPINIFHGDQDLNVGLIQSLNYTATFENHGKIITLKIIEGAAHYDVEFALTDEILDTIETTDKDFQNNRK